ncbi:MAG: hypothetical protein M9958_12500 [Chitinophagales bacterium]|nr:hypothetical protein [Chitinophagales bacterium]
MIEKIKSWSAIRIIRLILGVLVIVEGVKSNEWMFIVLGGVFALMALLNAGCSSRACATPRRKSFQSDDEEVTYEEVK